MAAGGGGGGSAEINAILSTGQLFYASTHGAYYDAKTAVVPPNTMLFIAQDPGDYCLVTLDEPIWRILQPGTRDILWSMLATASITPEQQTRIGVDAAMLAQALLQFKVYIPGDTYLDRTLQIGGQSELREYGRDFTPDASLAENEMGFYGFGQYTPGLFYKKEIYPFYVEQHRLPARNRVRVGSPVILPDVRQKLKSDIDNAIRVSEFISLLPDTIRIVFISSCGVIKYTDSPAEAAPARVYSAIYEKKKSDILAADTAAGYRNMMALFPALYHAASAISLTASSTDPSFVSPGNYRKSEFREEQRGVAGVLRQIGSGRRTQKVKRCRRRRTRHQR